MRGGLVGFVDRLHDSKRLCKLFVQHRQHGSASLFVGVAEEAQLRRELFAAKDYLVLTNGKLCMGRPGSGDFLEDRF